MYASSRKSGHQQGHVGGSRIAVVDGATHPRPLIRIGSGSYYQLSQVFW
jgi:hypothetical protein